MALHDDDLNGDGMLEAGEQAPIARPDPAPTPTPQPAPAAPNTPAAPSNVPPWLQQFRSAQDQRRTDFRTGMDAFYGGLGKLFEGDLKGGFGQRGTDFRDKLKERMQMPHGFASRLPWNQGQGAAPTEPNPNTPPDKPKEAAAKQGAWWAAGWAGGRQSKPAQRSKAPAKKDPAP